MDQIGFFDVPDHLARLSDAGDPLETLARAVDFEVFRPELDKALNYSNGPKGGRPPYDPVRMFKVLILAANNNLSDARMEFLIRDRFSWLRFLGFSMGKPTPDENTIRMFRERLTDTGALEDLMAAFNAHLERAGYLPMSGQIIDATVVPAPRQRNTEAQREAIKSGQAAEEIWPDKPAKARQKDTDARWTVKFKKARARKAAKGAVMRDIAIPVFGYKSHVVIDKRYGFIRSSTVTDAATHDGHVLREIVTTDNTASDVWGDTAYRSQENEDWLQDRGRVSRIHRKKPRGKPMPKHIRRGNGTRSKTRARVEHVFAEQKDRMGLFIRTIGLERAKTKIDLANLAYNLKRLVFHERRAGAFAALTG